MWLEGMSKETWARRGQRSDEVCGVEGEGIQIHLPRRAVVPRGHHGKHAPSPLCPQAPSALLPQPTHMPFLGC